MTNQPDNESVPQQPDDVVDAVDSPPTPTEQFAGPSGPGAQGVAIVPGLNIEGSTTGEIPRTEYQQAAMSVAPAVPYGTPATELPTYEGMNTGTIPAVAAPVAPSAGESRPTFQSAQSDAARVVASDAARDVVAAGAARPSAVDRFSAEFYPEDYNATGKASGVYEGKAKFRGAPSFGTTTETVTVGPDGKPIVAEPKKPLNNWQIAFAGLLLLLLLLLTTWVIPNFFDAKADPDPTPTVSKLVVVVTPSATDA